MSGWCVRLLFVAGLLGITCAATGTARADLVGLYQFNDASNLGLDSSARHNNLNVYGGGVSYTPAGEFGGGLSLACCGGLTTGTGLVPAGFPLGSSSYTISADFNTPHTGPLGIIGWGAYGSYDSVNALRLSDTGFRHYWWSDDLDASATTSDSRWHNVTVTFDAGTDTRNLYFDGSLIGSLNNGTFPNIVNANFAIGQTCPFCGGFGGGEYFVGTLDNVAVFDEALGPALVNDLVAGNLSFALAPEPASLWLLAGGLFGLGLLRRRRSW